MSSSEPVRVVVADDHPMYRYGLTAILDQADGVDVVATVGDGAALVQAVAEHVAIYEAVRDRRRGKAAGLMAAHIRDTSEVAAHTAPAHP